MIQCASWSPDGNTIVATCKDKTTKVVDPRAKSIVAETKSHEGAKGQRVLYLGSSGKILTLGSSKMSERQYKVWDPRNMEQPVHANGMDVATGVFMPFYDDDTKMLYLAGKGDANIKYFEVVDADPYLHFLDSFQATAPQAGMGFLPKHAMDTSKCEVARMLKCTAKDVEPISFTVPRRSDSFQDDIYPDTLSCDPSGTADEWFGGATVAPKTMSMKPGEGRKSSASNQTFKAVKTPTQLNAEVSAVECASTMSDVNVVLFLTLFVFFSIILNSWMRPTRRLPPLRLRSPD
eukprot:GFYU01008047.1.p1 GENE.GFYU01008047.1~~GFYU01008047.1.p1  ORF type:complete len:291 (-),score=85.19 GFYU01008047.1:200-1072(-)